jgi:hypothetical protein
MQHIFKTHETCEYNSAHLLADPQWTFVDVELDVGMELDATARRSDLGCVQCESEREARGAVKRSARHEAKRREAREA